MGEAYEAAAAYLSKVTNMAPEVGIICGSGLSGLSKVIENPLTVLYSDIPGFPLATVAGHHGELVFGTIQGVSVVCMRGRFHFYEGNDMRTVALPVRVMRLIGVKLLVVTNAAGGLNPDYEVGDIAIIQDHFGGVSFFVAKFMLHSRCVLTFLFLLLFYRRSIQPILAGNSPLVGANDDSLGPRFPATSDTYDEVLQDKVLACAKDLKLGKFMRPNATYCFVSGPSYESRAECRFLRSIGGDSVGMSTIPEILAAKHVGMKIVCLSMITNKVVVEKHKDSVHASHEEVLASVKDAGDRMMNLVKAFLHEKVISKYLSELPNPPPYVAPKNGTKRVDVKALPKSDFIGSVHVPTLLAAGLISAAVIFIREAIVRK